MGERSAADGTEEWLAGVFGPEPSAVPPVAVADRDGDAAAGAVVDLDTSAGAPPLRDESTANVNAGAKRTAMVLGAVLVAAMSAIVAVLVTFRASSPPPATHQPVPAAAATPTGPRPGGQVPADQDQAVAFAASANCPAGSTSAQALSDTASDSAWVCVRAGVDGQVLHVDLGKAYVLTAVSMTPGWVAKTPGGKDEWLQHRVVTRLQYIFDDTDRTIVTQDTGNTHGPVTLPLKKILASRVTVIVLQTSRPPADPMPTVAADSGGFLDSVLGSGGAPPAPDATQTAEPPPGEEGSDPVDATFAMSELKFMGHPPN